MERETSISRSQLRGHLFEIIIEERIKSLEPFLNVECEETIIRDDEIKVGIKFIKNAKKQ